MIDSRSRVLIVNPNSNTDTTAMLVRVAASAAPDFCFRGVTAAFGPRMIVDPPALHESARATVDAVAGAVRESCPDAVIVGAFGDPGLGELAQMLSIPVVGIGRSAVTAAVRGGRFAVATTTPALRGAIDDLVADAAPGADYAGTFICDGDPVALAAEPDRMYQALSGTVDEAVAAGARAVVIGGGPLSDSAARLAERTDAEIVEPVPAAVRALTGMLGGAPFP
ncbi:aspartate/glutamate racemase family protein [Tsukamurella serpentis]